MSTSLLRPLTLTQTKKTKQVSHPHSRKTFFAKLLGLFAAAGVIPSLFAKTNKQQISPESGSTTFAIRKDERAVARTGDRL